MREVAVDTQGTMSIEEFARCVAEARRSGAVGPLLEARGLREADWPAIKARQLAALATAEARASFSAAYRAAMGQGRAETESRPGAGSAQLGPWDANIDETAMVAPPDELRRLIREAEPRHAIPRGPQPAPRTPQVDAESLSGDTVLLPAPPAALLARRPGGPTGGER